MTFVLCDTGLDRLVRCTVSGGWKSDSSGRLPVSSSAQDRSLEAKTQRKASASGADGRPAACCSIDREDCRLLSKTRNVSHLTFLLISDVAFDIFYQC